METDLGRLGRTRPGVQMNELAQPAREGIECGFCRRPLFGLVAYCPYCGCKPDDRHQSHEALASEQAADSGMPAGALHPQEANPPHKGPQGTPLQGVPALGRILTAEQDGLPSSPKKAASPLLLGTAIAGVGALLLFWMGVKLLAPDTDEGASPRRPVSSSGVVSSTRDPPTGATPVSSTPPGTDTALPPQPNSRSLCSVANETAGLCKAQE